MTHLKVAVRVRPLLRRELEQNSTKILNVENGKTVAVTNVKVPKQHTGDSRERIRRFTFDFCFDENSTQDDVFRNIESIISNAIKRRFHSCILAYGQSSSGKTHTMIGFPHDSGVAPRLCQKIWNYIEETAVGDEMSRTNMFVSHLEIYNEKVRDLLCDTGQKVPQLKIRQHPQKGPYVQGLTEHCATDSSSLLRLLTVGNSNRRVAATLTNSRSSRSHSVFIINFDGIKLTLVDLAGSERAGASTSRFREGANINKSLVALGNVISALAEDSSKETRRRFIPYRDSVLTWLLKDTLGGNSDTLLIATISPSSSCYSETVNTLRFGQRAKLIVSIPVVVEDPKEKTIRELRAEIIRLKELLKLAPMANSKDIDKSSNVNTEKLLPVINFTNAVSEEKATSRLRRTFSVDHTSKKSSSSATTRQYGSEETISKPKKPPIATKSKPEKTLAAVGAKVDSIRRNSIKPRSHIVAAVTHRLYSKTKKKDVATDTIDLPATVLTLPPKELTICSNARSKLKELTRKALKIYRSKNEETQTDLFPVLRMKETSTDVDDFKTISNETKNAETLTVSPTMQDKETNCSFLENLKNTFVMTKSCGTQSSSNVSFKKYLEEPKIEVFNPHTANPIYTNTVNINISHNYLNGRRASDNAISDDSLEDQSNVCLPTPDLISNHNSLEPTHAIAKETVEILVSYATCSSVDPTDYQCSDLITYKPKLLLARSTTVPYFNKSVDVTNIPCVFASEICTQPCLETCNFFISLNYETAKPNIIESKTYSDDCLTITEPIVLKSIMKHLPERFQHEMLDSLEYHTNNAKKVRFRAKEDRMYKAMSEFLEQATILVNNLTETASEQEYNVEVSVKGYEQQRRRRKRKTYKDVNCQTDEQKQNRYFCLQTETEDFELPTNKYELLLEDSYKRLDEKIAIAREDSYWEGNDDSIESNAVTFSDYGSLPRRRKRYGGCMPSVYLKQLAAMRKQVIEDSREELANNSENSVL